MPSASSRRLKTTKRKGAHNRELTLQAGREVSRMELPQDPLVAPRIDRLINSSQNMLLLRVASRLQQIEGVLRFVQWGGSMPMMGCPFCGMHEDEGHSEGCEIHRALEPGSPIAELTDTLGTARELVRQQRQTVDMHLAMIARTLEDSDAVLARVSYLMDHI